MTAAEVLQFLEQQIHTVVAATTDESGRPVTCAIDIMDSDADSLYFLTARGKRFYDRLQKDGFLALTGMKGKDTMSSVAVSVSGKVKELGPQMLGRLFAKNPYMYKIYPTAQSREALTVFRLYAGTGEWFDLSRQPVERFSFAFGAGEERKDGYFITGRCTGCKQCAPVCPQNCIDFSAIPAVIHAKNCLHCGGCMAVCPQGAVIREKKA